MHRAWPEGSSLSGPPLMRTHLLTFFKMPFLRPQHELQHHARDLDQVSVRERSVWTVGSAFDNARAMPPAVTLAAQKPRFSRIARADDLYWDQYTSASRQVFRLYLLLQTGAYKTHQHPWRGLKLCGVRKVDRYYGPPPLAHSRGSSRSQFNSSASPDGGRQAKVHP